MASTWRERIGDYKLAREIGRGAFGIVYEATQISLGRQVALKVLPASLFPSETAVKQFHQEAMAAAQLSHPNIVTVYEAGQDCDLHYFSMEYVRGKSLAQIISERGGLAAGSELEETDFTASIEAVVGRELAEFPPAPPPKPAIVERRPPVRDECLVIASQVLGVAEGLQYAHDKGVIHQDVKPSNLVVNESDRLCLLDFGTAQIRRLGGDPELGQAKATPLYASPEQLDRTRGPVGPQTDVWSLGATLYEWVTTYPPFLAQDYEELRRRVLSERPVPPCELNPGVPPELEAIILKALERKLEHRYDSAGALAEDLRRFLRNEPTAASRAGIWGRLVLWRRRNPSLARAVLALVLLAVLTAGGILYAILSAETPLEAARRLVDIGAAQEARAVIEELLERIERDDEQWPEAMRLKAECLHDLGLHADRLEFYKWLLESHADRFLPGELLVGIGKTLDDRGRVFEAEAMLRKAIGEAEGLAEAHYELAKLLSEKRGDEPALLAEALAEYETALRLDGSLYKAHFAYGMLLADRGEFAQAVEHVLKAIELRSGSDKPKYYAGLAGIYLRMERLSEALASSQQAVASAAAEGRQKEAARYLKLSGQILLEKKDFAAAVRVLEEADTVLKDDGEVSLLLARAYLGLKQLKAAEEIAERLLPPEAFVGRALIAVGAGSENDAFAYLSIPPEIFTGKKALRVLELLKDDGFDSIRDDPRFPEIVAALEKRAGSKKK